MEELEYLDNEIVKHKKLLKYFKDERDESVYDADLESHINEQHHILDMLTSIKTHFEALEIIKAKGVKVDIFRYRVVGYKLKYKDYLLLPVYLLSKLQLTEEEFCTVKKAIVNMEED